MINVRNLACTALVLAALLAACGGQNVPIDAELSVTDVTVIYDGQPQQPEITFDPPGAEIGAEVEITPVGGQPLAAGVWPTDAGLYTVVVRASADQGGREVAGTLTIVPRPIDVAPDAGQGKVFDAGEPVLTYGFVDPAGDGIVPSSASGALGREAGEVMGTYAFTLGDLDAGANFALALADGAPVFTIAAFDLGDGGIVVSNATVTFDGEGRSVDVSFDPPAAGVGAVVTYGDLAPGVLPVDADTYVVNVVAGSGYVGGATGSLTILARPVNVVPSADQGKVYGETEPAFGFAFVDPSGDGIVPISPTGALARDAGEDVGSYDLTIGDLDVGANFSVTLAVAAFEIDPRTLVLAGFAVDAKTYDGSTAASGATFLDDRLDGDDVLVSFDVAFASAGAAASVTADFTDLAITGGADAGNYVLATASGSATATIARRALGVTNVLWADKVYDGGTGATASATLVTTDVVPGDAVALAAQLVGSFAASDVGTHAVVGSFALVGADVANYVVDPQPTGSADIDARPVALLDALLAPKVFDGDATATVTGTLQTASGFDRGVLPADVGALGFAATFAQTDASVDPVAVTVALNGAAAGNYVLDPPPTLNSAIAPATVTVTPDAGQTKTYGDADPVAFAFAADGLYGDDATIGGLVRAVGESIGSYAFTLGSLDAGANYALVLADGPATFGITTRAIVLTTSTTSTVYGESGDLTAELADGSSLRDGDVLAGDLARTGFDVDDHAFGLGSATLTRDAADVSGNYVVSFETYEVTARPLTITADAAFKTYGDALDLGITAFTVAASDVGTGLAGAEQVTAVSLVSEGSAATATVADGPYAIVASDAAGSDGFDPANYAIAYLDGLLTVDARTVTIGGAFTTETKPYDGTTDAGDVQAAGLFLIGLANDDDVALVAVAAFGDAAVGDDKVASLTGASSLTGADAGNYTLSLDAAPIGTGTMVKATVAFGITIAGTDFATEVVYDGDRTFQPNVTTSLEPVPSSEGVGYFVEIAYDPTGASVGSFNPVGTYTVTVTADDARYVGNSTQVVEVLARPVTIASSGTGKDYGAADPAMLPSLADGTFGRNDGFVLDGALVYDPGTQEAPFAVGSYPLELGSVVIVRGVRDVTANYAIAFDSDFEIEPATVTVSPVAEQGKIYGDPDPALEYLTSGLLEGDALDGALGREVGEDVASYAFTLGDLDAGANYALVLELEAPSFAIASRPLTLTTADPAFTYGEADLDLTAVLADGSTLREGDALTGALALSDAGAGEYAFLLGTVALSRDEADVASNYAVAFADYAMAARSATVSPVTEQGKIYGDPDLDFEYVADLLDGDELTGALGRDAGEDVGGYAFTLGDLANPNYALELVDAAPAFAVAARPITLDATVARKDFSTPDPDLSPVLTEGSTLRDGDALVGVLAHVGLNVGGYPLELGSVRVLRGEADVSGNYAITLGSFAIDPLPVAFDVTNADLVLDGNLRTHVFFGDGSEPLRGLTVSVTPDGATPSFRFTYRWTHDANFVAFPSPVTVQRIQGLGTYQVTITATSPNHVGATVLTVWVTDAIGVAFAEPTYEALVGATVPTQVRLVAADGSPRFAGPAPLVLDLSSDGAHVAFATDEEPASSTTVSIAAGATTADVGLVAATLGAAPAGLTATVADASGPGLAPGTATFATTARLAFAPVTIEIGAGATTSPVAVWLLGFENAPVFAPADLQVDLTSVPADVVFRNAADDADAAFATIASGSSATSFRMRSDAAGAYAIAGRYDGALAGVEGADLTFDVTPRPVVASIEPASVAKAQTLDLVLTGTGFADGVAVSFSGGDVVVDSVTVDSVTQVTVRVTISGTTDVGARSVTVDNVDGGSATTDDALVLTVPTLTANADGPFGVVEGGNRALSIATDLLANDGWTGTTAWSFDGVISASGVTYGVVGDVLTVTAAPDTGGSSASLTYRVRDTVFGTTATATVAIDVTLAPVEAILFTNPDEFLDFRTTEYTVPTFADVFASWPRFDGNEYFTEAPYSTNAAAWSLEGGTVVQPNNVFPGVGFVSPDGFEYFSFEATLYSGNADNDSIGLVAAFGRPGGSNVGLVAHRTYGGNTPAAGWGLSLMEGSSYRVLAEPTVDGFGTASGGWKGDASRVKVERIGDIVRIQATDWFSTDVATATPAYDPQSLITINLGTGVVTYRSGSSFVDVTLSSTQRAVIANLRGPQAYGYYTYSQPDSRYYNIVFEGGAATDTAILLTGYDAGLGAYTGSEVWRFAETWGLTGESIQTELNFPRDVTSVASPNPGSGYPGGYAAFGTRFRIEETKVVPLID